MFWKRVFIIILLLIGAIAADVTCESKKRLSKKIYHSKFLNLKLDGVDWEKCEAVPEILVDGCDYCDLRVKLSSVKKNI